MAQLTCSLSKINYFLDRFLVKDFLKSSIFHLNCAYLVTKRTALFIFSDPVCNDVVEDFKKQNKGDGDALLQNGHPLEGFEFLVFMIVSEVLHSLKQNRETEDQVDEGKEDFVSHVIHDWHSLLLPSLLILLQVVGNLCVIPSVDDYPEHHVSIVYQASAGYKVYS